MQQVKSYFNYTYAYPQGCFDDDGKDLNSIVFYVGKGSDTRRIDDHIREAAKGCGCIKCHEIKWIWSKGLSPSRRIVFDTLSEKIAFENERHLIQVVYCSAYLTNVSSSLQTPVYRHQRSQEIISISEAEERGKSYKGFPPAEEILCKDIILDVNEMAEMLNISYAKVVSLAKRGDIPAFKIGSQWRFYRPDLELFAKTQSKK